MDAAMSPAPNRARRGCTAVTVAVLFAALAVLGGGAWLTDGAVPRPEGVQGAPMGVPERD
jgi:hypothetical protein